MCWTTTAANCTPPMDDDRQLLLRKANASPPSYRVKYDDVEVGSISETSSHVTKLTF